MNSQTRIYILAAIGAAAVAVTVLSILGMQGGPQSGTGSQQEIQSSIYGMQGRGYLDLVSQLRARGATVEDGGKMQQDMFTINPNTMLVNHQDMWVFEFESEQDAKDQMSQVSPDGTAVGGRAVHQIGDPHFFEKGSMLVYYEGSDKPTLDLLTSVMGPQVAGKA